MSTLIIAAIVYERGEPIRDVMRDFVKELQGQGLNVHGVLQEKPADMADIDEGCGVDAIDIKQGIHVPLVRPTQYDLDHGICSLDLSQLTEVSMILRRALDDQADVVVVEKFGKHEKDGGGIADDLMAVIAEGTPTIVSVPKSELESWNSFRGDIGDIIPCDLEHLRRWWKSVSK